jgi:hypothetical protein
MNGTIAGFEHVVTHALSNCSSAVGLQCVPDCPSCSGTTIRSEQGPQPVDATERAVLGDVGFGGIVGLGAGVSEFARDALHALDSVCWARSARTDPACDDDASRRHTIRGASWELVQWLVDSGRRWPDQTYDAVVRATSSDFNWPEVGFRCVRAAQ